MNSEDFQQEELNEISFPPRKSIHGHKNDKKNKKLKINTLQMLLGSFIFIIILLLVILTILDIPGKDKNEDGFDSFPRVEIEDYNDKAGNSNNNGTDSITGDNKPDENVDEEQPAEGENSNSQVPGQTDSTENQSNNAGSGQQANSEDKIHVVEAGENLYRISVKYYNTGQYYNALAKYNGINDSNDVYAGMELKIPNVEDLPQE